MNVCSSMGKQLACPGYCRLVNSALLRGRNPLKVSFRHFTIPPANSGKLVTQQTPIVSGDEVQIESIGKVVSKLQSKVMKAENDKESTEGSNSVSPEPQSTSTQNDPLIVTDITLLQATEPEVLLQMSCSPHLSLKQACLIVSCLGKLAKNDESKLGKLKADKRFVGVCNLIIHGNHSNQPHSLLLAINGLHNLGYAKNSEIQQALETELKWGLRRCPIRFLARVVDLFSEEEKNISSAADDDQSLLNAAIETLQRRWVEVTSGTEFIAVFKIIHLLGDNTKAKLEDRSVEMIPEFTPMEMVKLLIILGIQKRRPTPLLRAIAFHLSKKETKIPIKDLIELVYALNELTFCDPVLMAKLSESIIEQIPLVENSALISSLVTSLGQMRYKHKDLIRVLEEWISKNVDTLRPFDCASYLLTSAVLSIPAENNTAFYVKAKSLLSKPIEESPMEWTNIVHCFAVSNECTPELLSSVLQPAFIKQMDNHCGKMTTPLVKLLNLNAIAKHKLVKGYNGPLIDNDYVSKWTADVVRPSDQKLSNVVLDSLGNFLPRPKYIKANKKLENGVHIDAVCVLNEKWEPVPVDLGNMKKDWTKVAIILMGYPSMCLGIKDPTGSALLNIKLLQCEGYKVVTVPYTEFSAQEKIVKRVQYLEQKIKLLSSLKRSEIIEPKTKR